MARRRRKQLQEPTIEDDDLVEWGGERYFAVDFTEGGAPIGLTEAEWREACERAQRDVAFAGRAITQALAAASPGSDVAVQDACDVGDGSEEPTHRAWAARAEVRPDHANLSGAWVALVPVDAADRERPDARVFLEVEVVSALGRQPLPFRVPRVLAPSGGILVRERLPGTPLALRAGRQPGVQPWGVVAEVAAAIHAMGVPELVFERATRREHALEALVALERLQDPVADDARSWALERLPPDEPASLLHGDLRGPNVLVHPSLPPAVLGWAFASGGDPAYDLAVVTQGRRRPFHVDGGLERLIDAYRAAGGGDVRVEHVRLHELALLAGWALSELDDGRGREAVERFHDVAGRILSGRRAPAR